MSIKLYVGNLSFQTSSEDLRELFSQAGEVENATVVEDRDTGRSRGFGFVELASESDAEAVMARFNGKELKGRILTINEVRPRVEYGDIRGVHRKRRGDYIAREYGQRFSYQLPKVEKSGEEADVRVEGDEQMERDIKEALRYVQIVVEKITEDWAEVEQLKAETRELIASIKVF